jgi:hypothetical protein
MIRYLQCKVTGCREEIEINESISMNSLFICKRHPRSDQVEAAGRVYDPEHDEKDQQIHFQTHAFDKNLGCGSSAPEAE